MKTSSEAVKAARQFNRLYAQVMRELGKRNRNGQRIGQLKSEAAKASTRLVKLMGW